jgi:putative ABC transport system ATP-binding protein
LQQLKLANALLERPRILVLSRLFDLLDPEPIERAVNELRSQAYSTVIYFSNRRFDLGFDRFLYLEPQQQRYFDKFEEFCTAMGRPTGTTPPAPRSQGGA